MAAQKNDVMAQSRKLIEEARSGVFFPVYLLMGEEPYYPQAVCQAVIDNCIDESQKDFNETICYGNDVTVEQVVSAARRFPMMAERQLVVVKEAQNMKSFEDLAIYCSAPLDSTVLVLLFSNASVDKRKALYKSVQKIGAVIDSHPLRDYEVPGWIGDYYRSRGLSITPPAASLLYEATGSELSKIVMETDKLLRNLPEGETQVGEADIEKNVGISRQYSIFELNKEICSRNASRSLVIAEMLGHSAKFALPAAVSALFAQFYRVLKYDALLSKGSPAPEEKAEVLKGVNPYFYREYDTAARNYPLPKAMAVISLLCEYDYLGKGGDGGDKDDGELLVELVSKILNV